MKFYNKPIYIILSTAMTTVITSCTGRTEMTCVEDIKRQLRPLPAELFHPEFNIDSIDGASEDYFSFYDLDIESEDASVSHTFGTFTSGDYTLAAHIYVPENYTAVLVCVHGYLTHVVQFKHVIKYFTERRYAVACFDMPGHGLSSGPRGAINDFNEYTDALNVFTDYVFSQLDGPYYLTGFSMGGASVINYLLTDQDLRYDKYVLAGPLVRNYAWKLSLIGYDIYKPFCRTVPRLNRKDSSNDDFNDFNIRKDRMHLKEMPVGWLKALHEWNDRIEQAGPVNREVLILQGTEDTVVDYKYNIEFLKRRLPASKVVYIEGARHELFNESLQYRGMVLDEMERFLRDR